MKKHRLLCAAMMAAAVLARIGEVRLDAQTDPRQILAGMILQVQTGTPNPLWYGTELWLTIALQTGDTGVYPQLAQLGVVQNVIVTQQAVLPGGMLYAMTAQHAFGRSYWMMGIGSLTNRIEYATFAAGPGSIPYTLPGAPTVTPTLPSPAPSVGTPASEPPVSRPKPGDRQSEACKKFPNLC